MKVRENCAQTMLAGLGMLAFASGAEAQTGGVVNVNAPPNVGAVDIVVTATRDARSLQDVPMSVSVASGKQIERLNIFDVKDVQQLSPGLEMTNTVGRNNVTSLRGVTFDPDQGTGPAVDIYVNDIPIDAQTAFTAIYDIDQIEVLRGPQGALRGRTAPAGAITIRTRRPNLDSLEGYAQATGSEDHAYNVQGAVSVPLMPGKLALRVAGLLDGNRLNQVNNVNRDERSKSRTHSGRATLAWRPTDAVNVVASYQYLKADNRQEQQVFGPGNRPAIFPGTNPPVQSPELSGPPASVDDYIAVSEGIRRFRNTTHIFNLQADWNLGGATLFFAGAHQYSKLIQESDQDVANAVPGYQAVQTTRIPYPVDTGELRLVSNDTGQFWNWSVSAFHSRQGGTVRVNQPGDQFFGPFPAQFGLILPITVDVVLPVKATTTSIAASSRFKFTEKLKLEVGLRYGRLKSVKPNILTLTSPGAPAFGVPPFSSTSLRPDDLTRYEKKPLTGGATLTYEFNRDVTAYAAYGRSFREGTFGTSTSQNIDRQLLITDPERSDAFELGLKTAFLDRRISVNIAAFYQKYNGYISRIADIAYDNGAQVNGQPVGRPDGVVDGVALVNFNGDATSKGVEGTVSGRPSANWDFSVSASYIRAKYDKASIPCNDFNFDGRPDSIGTPRVNPASGTNISYCVSNSRLSNVPDFTLSANSEIRFATGSVEPFLRGLFTHRPAVTLDSVGVRLPSRQLLNLFAGIRSEEGGWEINAFVKNALNQKRITNVGASNSLQPTLAGISYDSGYRIVNVTNPREWGITTVYRF